MGQLHIVLLPMPAHGHVIPMLEMAKLFRSSGLKTTIIATPAFAEIIKTAQQSGYDMSLGIIKFPPQGSSLPDNIVSLDQASSPDLIAKFSEALSLLQEPVEKFLRKLHPINGLISDMFLPWSVDSAAKFGIPRLVFHGTSSFALSAAEQMRLHKPYKNASSDSEPFVLPDFPQEMMFVRTQVSGFVLEEENYELLRTLEQMRESESRSYGVVFNSFYELESAYADYCKNILGRRAWQIGPFSLCNSGSEEKGTQRGKELAIDKHECLAWLDTKRPNSVVFLCFGSMTSFTTTQLHEIALGLEASGQDFIWVVRKEKNGEENEELLPKGLEGRVKGKGLIVRGWAPQVMILDHPAIGAFVTHCGWNSTLEGVCAGVPMVTWPLFAEQFYNEKLVIEVLKIGVSIGNKKWQTMANNGVSNKAIAKAVKRAMVGEEASEMRNRAKYYKEMARKAVEEGGSSCTSLATLIGELSIYRAPKEHEKN